MLSMVPLSVSPARGEDGETQSLRPDWPAETETSRPWARWWWPGSAVDEGGLTAQLESLAEAGLGGVEITPIYGARGAEERYVEFLSPRWVELLAHTGAEAERLGMQVDMATGTGWPFGGPWVSEAEAATRLVWRDGELAGEPTGQQVKRAAPGGEGLVLDPYSAEAIGRYLERFDTAFENLPEGVVRSQFHDSFEYYGASWSDDLPERFESMHGYALGDYGAALAGEADDDAVDADTLARVKHDYRETLDTLHQEYLKAWGEWAHGHGWLIRNQSHGAPANLLDLYGIADIPETEVFGSTPFPIPGLRREPEAIRSGSEVPEPLVTRMASSAAHVTGKPLVSSETATWLRDHWKVTLAAVKPEVDRIFLDGINHVFYHGTVYSPPDVPWPGWLFYASTQFNPRNPWWEDFSALNAYVDRVQRVLQSGEPGNDVLLYWPIHDLWQDPDGLVQQLTVHNVDFILDTPCGEAAKALQGAGYAFDYISDRQVATLRAADGKLRAPGGDYAAIVVPPAESMPVETLESLLELARNGAVVIFEEWPEDVPGLGRLESRREQFRARLDGLPEGEPGTGGLIRFDLENGAILQGDPVAALGETDAVPEPMFEAGLESIRRVTPEGTDYFIANLTGEAFDGWAPLGSEPAAVTLLDPLDGHGGVAKRRVTADGTVEIRLQLAPGESIVARGLRDGPATGPAWEYLEEAGSARTLEGPWQITFLRGGPELPDSIETDSLRSWTELGGDETERFAGTARYTTTFTLEDPEAAGEWILDLGDLRDSARVSLNGRPVATVWSLPFRTRVGAYLQAGENELAIEVTNTAANRIRDLDRSDVDWKIMHEINFVDINYRPFDASDWDVQPAGLLGPVRLTPKEVAPKGGG